MAAAFDPHASRYPSAVLMVNFEILEFEAGECRSACRGREGVYLDASRGTSAVDG